MSVHIPSFVLHKASRKRRGVLNTNMPKNARMNVQTRFTCVYIRTYIHACMHAYIHTYIHASIHSHIYIHFHTITHMYAHVDVHTEKLTYREACFVCFVVGSSHPFLSLVLCGRCGGDAVDCGHPKLGGLGLGLLNVVLDPDCPEANKYISEIMYVYMHVYICMYTHIYMFIQMCMYISMHCVCR